MKKKMAKINPRRSPRDEAGSPIKRRRKRKRKRQLKRRQRTRRKIRRRRKKKRKRKRKKRREKKRNLPQRRGLVERFVGFYNYRGLLTA